MPGVKDLSFLNDDLRDAARLTNHGSEVMWPRKRVVDVINAIADSGRVVLGLDLRSDGDGSTPDGLDTEVPWSDYRDQGLHGADQVEAARGDALRSLSRPNLSEFDDYRWILVTWSD